MDNPQLYTQHNNLQRETAGILLEEVLQNLTWNNEKERILDIGCGSGDVTVDVLRKKLPSGKIELILGTDLTAPMVKYARDNHSVEGVKFDTLDIADKTIESSSVWHCGPFQKIFSFNCLHWVSDQRQAVQNIYKLLGCRGEAILLFLAKRPMFCVYEKLSIESHWRNYIKLTKSTRIAKTLCELKTSPYHFSSDPKKEFSNLLQEIGFEVKLCQVNNYKYKYDSLDYLSHLSRSSNPFFNNIPRDLHDDFMKDCMTEALQQKIIVKDESLHNTVFTVEYPMIKVHAKKK